MLERAWLEVVLFVALIFLAGAVSALVSTPQDDQPLPPQPPPAPQVTDSRIEAAISWALARLGSGAYDYLCLKFVQDAYQYGAHAYIRRFSYAKQAADSLRASLNRGVPPRGAFVFYHWWGTIHGVYKDWGHAALSLGNGLVVHAKGLVREERYDALGLSYIGWAWPPVSPPLASASSR